MTHDELLAKINKRIAHYIPAGIDDQIAIALRAVVELHKPVSVIIGDRNGTIHTKFSKWQCKGCYGEYNQPRGIYPCPTIQAIQEQLK